MDGGADIPAVSLSDLRFSWPGKQGFTLDIPSFQVARGERLFLSGESGAGKSTLLGLICGINTPDRGRVEVSGVNLPDLNGAARDQLRADGIGVIFQMFNLLPFASGLENILLPLSFSPTRRARLTDQKAEALRLTSALDLADDLVTGPRAGSLSIGQQQRIAAARALIGAPPLVIADEPTSSLDAGAQAAFIELLMEQVVQAGSTLIMVSHDDRLTKGFDRVIHLRDIAKTERAAA